MTLLRRRCGLTGLVVLVGALLSQSAPVSAAAEPVWDDGTAAVFADGVANVEYGSAGEVKSISCASPGNCAAVGDVFTDDYQLEAFVMSSTEGEWGHASPVDFPDELDLGYREDVLSSVSCWSPGDCTAVGKFNNESDRLQPFIVTSTDGDWATAQLVENPFGVFHGGLNSVSCSAAGDCTAVGYFEDGEGQVPFTISSDDGTWEEEPSISDLSDLDEVSSEYATLLKVSCATAGNCSAVGFYSSSDPYQLVPFTVTSIEGEWGPAEAVEFPDDVHVDYPYYELLDVACASAGNCTAVGDFVRSDDPYIQEAFTVTSIDGEWDEAELVEFPDGVQSDNPNSALLSVSCVSAGNCTAGGSYTGTDGSSLLAFTVSSAEGDWGLAEPVGIPDDIHNEESNDSIKSVSCVAVDTCSAVGVFRNSEGSYEGFAVNMTDGTWGIAHPAYVATDSGHSRGADGSSKLTSVSCSLGGLCSAGGRIKVFDGDAESNEIFVMSSSEAPASSGDSRSTSGRHTSSTDVPATEAPTTNPPIPDLPPPTIETVEGLPIASTPIVNDSSVDAGAPITASFGGFEPNEFVQLLVASTPQIIGSGYSDAAGRVTISGTLPPNLTTGAHTLAVYAPGSGIGFSQPITVSSPTLPVTGSGGGDGAAVVAIWLTIIGLFAIYVARRRMI